MALEIDLQKEEVPVRELRLGSITGYTGTVGELNCRAKCCGALENKERCFSQTSACSSGCAQGYLARILDSAIVNHGPVGCIAETPTNNYENKWGRKWRGLPKTNIRMLNTNMTEHDTIFGAAEKLKAAVREAYRRFAPKAIFITTSCVSGIIGEDVPSIVSQLREEIPVPLAPVFCEGFKSQIWASGFDAAFHAILLNIVKPPQQKSNKVNMINFNGSARVSIRETLARFGVEPVFMAPFSTIAELEKASEALATISICGTLSGYFGNALEKQYGVPYIRTIQPHGIAGTDAWLRSIGELLGKEREAEEYITGEKKRIAGELDDLRKKLTGVRAVVGMGPNYAHNYIRLLRELGIDVVWGASWHYDPVYDNGETPAAVEYLLSSEKGDLPFSVADQQVYEIVNLLNRLKPDLYIGRHPGMTVWATKLGVPSVMINDEFSAYGYQGFIDFGHRVLDVLTNRNFTRKLAERAQLPYTDWWLEQDSFKFLQSDREEDAMAKEV
jgi:nitrogenase molybdenum-iron protein alpha chain